MVEISYEKFFDRRTTLKETIPNVLILVGATLLCILGIVYFGALFSLPIAALIVVVYWQIIPKFRTEVEYIFFGRELEIAIIYGKRRRVTKKEIDLRNVEMIAPADSKNMDFFVAGKKQDFSSGMNLRRTYSIILRGNRGLENIVIEPDETLLKIMKQCVGSKMYLE